MNADYPEYYRRCIAAGRIPYRFTEYKKVRDLYDRRLPKLQTIIDATPLSQLDADHWAVQELAHLNHLMAL